MTISKDLRVQSFLRDLLEVTPLKHDIILACRKLVLDTNADVDERIMYGGIMFGLKEDDFGGLFVSKNHVSFEFTQGVELDDPMGILEGAGKFRRHIKLKTIDDVEQKAVAFFVQQLKLNR